ncbi:hypothetical protein D7147_04165 [Micromonospora musae]|uniref:Rad50/SbcC-type AAA domain-containing protein n=1 Tax=Micromonospora musae TaxID=1894970 RepID=A0ABX9RKM2_9ACTN|nr:ATP-binding protein [Micromonospora musae]RKN24187.1 hypothetical protein D7147_04165 [Micromonospora musae]
MTPERDLESRDAHTRIRGIRILRLRLAGHSKPYEVDFRDEDGSPRPLSIIAGPTNTGKTSILELIAYAFGGSSYPDHEEIVRQVRAAIVEADTTFGPITVERAIEASTALLFDTSLDRAGETVPQPHPVGPPSDPASLSSLLLSTVDLNDIQLKVAPTQQESATHIMSFRNLMWLCMVLNERVGSTQILWEGNYNKNRHLIQTVDAIFGVHENEGADLASRISRLNEQVLGARREIKALEEFIREQGSTPREQLQEVVDNAEGEFAAIRGELDRLDWEEAASAQIARELRDRHQRAARGAIQARQRLRDREALVSRYASLRAQYNDDIRKLTLLKQAKSIFDQLSVQVCPACLGKLPEPPSVQAGQCSMCSQPVSTSVTSLTLGTIASARETVAGLEDGGPSEAPNGKIPRQQEPEELLDEVPFDDAGALEAISADLTSTRRRFKELNEYWLQLNDSLPALREARAQAEATEGALAAEVNRAASGKVTPYVAARESLLARRQAASVRRDRANAALKQWRIVEQRQRKLEVMAGELAELRSQNRSSKTRPDRNEMLARLSSRYRQILADFEYPKHNDTGSIDESLVPSVRHRPYRNASSGGQVLQTLAWILAIFEVAYEQGANHPGFLLIDTPQKNLGGKAAENDEEFADVRLVERFYRHIINWLDGPGRGAQIIIVDNTPPAIADPYIAVQFTRNPNSGRFGLIDNEVG